MKINPLGLNVLLEVETENEEITKAGIIIPESAKDKKPPVIAKVIAIGPDVTLIKVGQNVLFAEYGFDPMEIDGLKYQIGPEEKILGIIK